MIKYEAGMAKITQLTDSIESYRNEVKASVPKHLAAQSHVKEQVEIVEKKRQEYINVSTPTTHSTRRLIR